MRPHSRKRLRKPWSATSILRQFVVLVLDLSTIHGFNHISARNRHPAENFLWLFFVIVGAYGAYFFAHSTLSRYENSPTVISLERNYQEWNTTFPAATICPYEKIDEGISEHVIRKWFGSTANTSEAAEWLKALFSANFENFDQLDIDDRLPATQYLELLTETTFKLHFDASTTTSVSNMTRYLTEWGMCYAFNSAVATYNTPEYWIRNTPVTATPPLTNELYKGNPLEGDMSTNIITSNSAFHVYIHSPFEVPDISKSPVVVPDSSYLVIDLTVSSTVSSEDIRSVAISRRKCRFMDESNLEISPVYSYSHCRSECRMRLAHKLCDCVPYFYRPTGKYTTCNVQGMKCLGRHKGRLLTLEGENCKCMQSCEEEIYQTHSLFLSQPWTYANLKYGLLRFPRTRLKRSLFFTRSDLLVQLGGSASLCLGCSVLSFCELLYLFTLRLILFILNKTRSRPRSRN